MFKNIGSTHYHAKDKEEFSQLEKAVRLIDKALIWPSISVDAHMTQGWRRTNNRVVQIEISGINNAPVQLKKVMDLDIYDDYIDFRIGKTIYRIMYRRRPDE